MRLEKLITTNPISVFFTETFNLLSSGQFENLVFRPQSQGGPPTWAQLGPTHLGPAWAHPLGPSFGPPTWPWLGPTHLGPSGGKIFGETGPCMMGEPPSCITLTDIL